MRKILLGLLSTIVLLLGENYCKKDLDVRNGMRGFEYSYVCIDNRLFLQAYSERGNTSSLGLSQVDNMKCECVKENKTYKNMLGFEVNDSIYVIKIK